jgi:HEAT repeat protein
MPVPGAVRLRTAPELATLLLELGRLIRARRYYEPGDPKLASLFERSLRAWQADLSRRGPLVLELVPDGFREHGARGVLSHPRLGELGRELAERGIKSLRFEPGLDADAFAAFAEVLATDAGRTASRGGFAAALYAHSPAGIVVNDLAPGAEPPPPAPPAPAEAVPAPAPAEPKTPPRRGRAPHEEEPTAPLAGGEAEAPAPPAGLSADQELDAVLQQLDECDGAASYLDLARRTTLLAERAFDEGRREEAFRVFSRFAAHATGKESEPVRNLAQGFLRSLLEAKRLAWVIERALTGLDAGQLEANQVLLALGGGAVPALLDAASALDKGAERDRLAALVVTFGEEALRAVLERLAASEPPARLRAVVRIAGELQHPEVVAPLTVLLESPDRSVREEAVRALVHVGSDAAVAGLAAVLGSATPGLGLSAMHGLATTGSARAVEPLRRSLEAAVEARDTARAKEVIRALGRLARPEAGSALVSLLERRVRLGGGWLRELKAAAVAALGGIPGDEAVAALAQVAQDKDAQLRRSAQTALDRRAHGRGRPGSQGS